MLRSQVAHAKIRKIDVAAARKMPGVLGAHRRRRGGRRTGDVPCHAPLNNRDGSPRHDTPRPALAIGKVRHVGQPVALVVAEALAQARDAADAIEIDYEQLPSVTDARAALEIGAPQLFNSIPGNLVFECGFREAAHVTTLELVNNRVVVNAMEPRNAIGDYDAISGRLVLYSATQGSHFVRDPLAEAVLKLPKEKLRGVAAECRWRLRHEGFCLSRAGACRMGGRQAQAAGSLAVGTGCRASSPTIKAAIITPGPSSRSTPGASFSQSASRSSPMWAPTSRRWVHSFPRAQPT